MRLLDAWRHLSARFWYSSQKAVWPHAVSVSRRAASTRERADEQAGSLPVVGEILVRFSGNWQVDVTQVAEDYSDKETEVM